MRATVAARRALQQAIRVPAMNRAISTLAGLALALSLTLGPLVSGAYAETPITYRHETEAEFEQQIAAKKIKTAEINKSLRTVRVTLDDGEHVLGKYPKHQVPQTIARLKAAGATVSVLSKKEGERQAAKGKKHKHKIRYIVGGVLIVLIVIGGAVWLIRRRRQID
jgi:ATP-dependent Zn protease